MPRPFQSAVLLFVLAAALPVLGESHKAPPIQPAKSYPAVETHEDEKLSIAIDPCVKKDDCPFFRLDYAGHAMLPVRVVFTNDGDQAVSLDDVRIQFISANKDIIPAALLEDLNRRLFTRKSAEPRHIPGIPIAFHKEPIDKKITEDDKDFGFKTTTVPAHGTIGGYLFYDIKDLDDPPLRGAEIYVKEAKTADGKMLSSYDIPLDKWLKAHPERDKANTR
jgi:hypothetical protein